MILIDTSAWIAFFREAGSVAELVEVALREDQAACCGPIATELRRGLASSAERGKVLPLLDGCHWLEQPPALWEEAGDLGYALRRKGLTVKTFDLLIATYALSHEAHLLTTDSDFALMRKKGIALELVPVS
jgi:predicted nucleic acid-binding protein